MELVQQIAVPRANGSAQLGETRRFLTDYLQGLGVHVTVQEFFLRPYLQPLVGTFLVFLGAAALWAIWRGRRWLALVLALLIPALYFTEFELNIPVVSWIGGTSGYNVIAGFGPAPADVGRPDGHAGVAPRLFFTAHYDSKTEPFDHQRRQAVYNGAALGMVVLVVAALGHFRRRWRGGALALGVPAVLLLGILAYSFAGGFFAARESPGARDDAAAVAVLLGLSAELAAEKGGGAEGGTSRVNSAIVPAGVVLFDGEEVNMQGSAAFARANPLGLGKEAMFVNLEGIGGAGPWRYYERGGGFLRKYPSSPKAKVAVDGALRALGLQRLVPARFGFDDAGPLLAAGWRAATFFQDEPGHPSSYHSGEDNVSQVVPERLEEAVRVLREVSRRSSSGPDD